MTKNHAWEEQIRMKILIRKIFPTRKLCLCALNTILTGEKNVRRNGVIMRRRWGLRGGACLLTCMLLTGCVGTAEETGTDSVGQAQEETVEAGDNDTEKTYYALPTEAEESEIYVEPVEGLSEDELKDFTVTAVVSVTRQNLIANASFEESDYSMWQVISEGASVTDYQDKESDAYSGNLALHFWSEKAFSFTVEQTIEGLEPGTYECGFYIQGGDVGTDAKMYLFAETEDGRQEEATAVSGWCNWQNPQLSEVTVGADGTITVGAYISSGPGGWGTLDDFYLYRVE